MDVTLYKNFSVPRRVGKNLTQVAKYSAVQMVEPVNDNEARIRITTPTDTLKWSNVNYFEWDGAFYFLDSVDKQANGLSVLNGTMDLLETYKSAVLECRGRVVRSTSAGSPRAADDNRLVTVERDRTTYNFSGLISESTDDGAYAIITSQYNYTGEIVP